MQPVSVYVGNYGHVVIRQEEQWDDDKFIVLHPNQVPILIKWLKEVAAEANSRKDFPQLEDAEEAAP